MKFKGVDTAASISAEQAALLKQNGISFVGRYLADPSQYKALTDTEAEKLLNAGLAIVLIWETYASRAREGAAAGTRDGYSAYALAKQLQVPEDCVIYFAVDYDAPRSDYPLIEQYLYAAKAACAPYRCGVYGKADLVNSIKADAYMQCVAWSYGLVSDKANIYQYQWQGGPEAQEIAKKIGVAVDMDSSKDPSVAGMWRPEKKKMWYDDAMKFVADRGWMNDGRPEDPVTRAELATVLYRIFGEGEAP